MSWVSEHEYGEKLWQRCARRGCSNRFRPQGAGRNRKRFCSSRCLRTDQYRRLRHARSWEQRADECPHGHVRTEANTHINKRGSKECRICKRDRMRARRAA